MGRRSQENPLFLRNTDAASGNDNEEAAASAGGCGGCLHRFCCGWSGDDGSSGYVLQDQQEIAAGSKIKWKNLIRKLGRICNPRRYDKPAAAQFQYSPESYALNFSGDCAEEDGSLLHSFSTRYAPPGLSIPDQQRKVAL